MSERCDFCDGKPVPGEEYCGGGFHTVQQMLGLYEDIDDEVKDGIQLTDFNLLRFDNSSREYAPLGVRIHYCPMCGKKLMERIEEENK